MLIRSIRAVNFMRFASLEARDLPERGVIGIEGPNESGKTTIGEALLFAFFGRTRLSDRGGVDRLIRWDSDNMSVEVAFVSGGEEYLLFRQIDRAGTNYTKLLELGSRREVAAGNLQVEAALAGLLRFGCEEALDSFFLQQCAGGEASRDFIERMAGVVQVERVSQQFDREIEQLEREFALYQKDIQRHAGQLEKYERNIARLDALRAEVDTHSAQIESLTSEQEGLQGQRAALKSVAAAIESEAQKVEKTSAELPSAWAAAAALVDERIAWFEGRAGDRDGGNGETTARLQSLRPSTEMLHDLARRFAELRDGYAGLQQTFHQKLDRDEPQSLVSANARKERELEAIQGRAGVLSVVVGSLFLVSAVVGALLAVILFELPGHALVLERLSGWEVDSERATAALAFATGFSLLVSFVFLFRRVALGARAGAAREALEHGSHEIESILADQGILRDMLGPDGDCPVNRFLALAASLRNRGLEEELHAVRTRFDEASEGAGVAGCRKLILGLAEGLRQSRAALVSGRKQHELSIRDAERQVKRARSERDRKRAEVREYEAQIEKRHQLEEACRDLESRAAEVEAEIAVRRAGKELLEETARATASAVGPSLTRLLRELLPRVTGERYRDVKVTRDLSVKVFTSEKCDFAEVSELSGGTREVLRLALRLALAQAFVRFRTRQPQFLFLDEPFKMMDPERSLAAVKVLRVLSPELCQWFVVQPSFADDQRAFVDCWIRTYPGDARAVVELAAPREDDVGASGHDVLRSLSDQRR